MSDEIPAGVRNLITEQIHSVAKLELLLMLQEKPEKRWTAEEAARALYIAKGPAENLLNELLGGGLAERDQSNPPHFHYAPRSKDLDKTVVELADFYRQRRVTVITLIHSAPVDKLRTFADAFKIIRPPEGT